MNLILVIVSQVLLCLIGHWLGRSFQKEKTLQYLLKEIEKFHPKRTPVQVLEVLKRIIDNI